MKDEEMGHRTRCVKSFATTLVPPVVVMSAATVVKNRNHRCVPKHMGRRPFSSMTCACEYQSERKRLHEKAYSETVANGFGSQTADDLADTNQENNDNDCLGLQMKNNGKNGSDGAFIGRRPNRAPKIESCFGMSGQRCRGGVASRDVGPPPKRSSMNCSMEVPARWTIGTGRGATTRPPVALGGLPITFIEPTMCAVYIALPTGVRKQWVIAAAKAGKACVCAKTRRVHADDAEK